MNPSDSSSNSLAVNSLLSADLSALCNAISPSVLGSSIIQSNLAESVSPETERDPLDAPAPNPQMNTPSDSPSVQEQMMTWSGKITATLARGVGAIVEIGQQLIEAKDALGHGYFAQMVDKHLPFTLRQAEKYMRVAKHEVLANPNFGSLLPRSITLLNKLSAMNKDDLYEVLKDVESRLITDPEANVDSQKFWGIYFPEPTNQSKDQPPPVRDTKPEQTGQGEETPIEPNKADEIVNGTDQSTPDQPTVAPEASNDAEDQGTPSTPTPAVGDEGTDNSPAPPGASDPNKIVNIADHQASKPNNTDSVEKDAQDAVRLVKIWESSMAGEWSKVSKTVRVKFIQWLQDAVDEESSEIRKAA